MCVPGACALQLRIISGRVGGGGGTDIIILYYYYHYYYRASAYTVITRTEAVHYNHQRGTYTRARSLVRTRTMRTRGYTCTHTFAQRRHCVFASV